MFTLNSSTFRKNIVRVVNTRVVNINVCFRKFSACFNNHEFKLLRYPADKDLDQIDLNREWQRFLLKNYGKDYLDYHEYRTDTEIKNMKNQMQEIELNKNFIAGSAELRNNHEKLARKIMQLTYERTL